MKRIAIISLGFASALGYYSYVPDTPMQIAQKTDVPAKATDVPAKSVSYRDCFARNCCPSRLYYLSPGGLPSQKGTNFSYEMAWSSVESTVESNVVWSSVVWSPVRWSSGWDMPGVP